ncbi:hypothetical protein MN202_04690 [Rheinheimera muenzenbergensis]|uniref:Nucleotidyltransferase n=1 Tax=Rheinheimera muenzenbergensis TaxID=1193628 RepID=A0ABU8C3N0_9GAMM
MQTDVFDDILCQLLDDELAMLRTEFAAIMNSLNNAGAGFFLIGDVAVAEYTNPFATTELDIQLLNHSLSDAHQILSVLNLDFIAHGNQLIIKSKQLSEREYDYRIYLHAPIHFVSQHYKQGRSAKVLGIQGVPVSDIQTLVWFQLHWMLAGGRHCKLQYKVHLAQLFGAELFKIEEARRWLIESSNASMISLFNKVVSDIENAKLNPGLTWGEVQELKRLQHEPSPKAETDFLLSEKNGGIPRR